MILTFDGGEKIKKKKRKHLVKNDSAIPYLKSSAAGFVECSLVSCTSIYWRRGLILNFRFYRRAANGVEFSIKSSLERLSPI